MKSPISVCDTILRQMRYGYKRTAIVMSWGVTNTKPLDEQLGGVTFKVNGYKFKGTVKIILTGEDLYDITLINEDGSPFKKLEGEYFDTFTESIDNLIEKQDNYTF